MNNPNKEWTMWYELDNGNEVMVYPLIDGQLYRWELIDEAGKLLKVGCQPSQDKALVAVQTLTGAMVLLDESNS